MWCMLLSRESTITQGDSHEKCNTFKGRRARLNAFSDHLIRKGEPINLGSVAYLKTIRNQDLNWV